MTGVSTLHDQFSSLTFNFHFSAHADRKYPSRFSVRARKMCGQVTQKGSYLNLWKSFAVSRNHGTVNPTVRELRYTGGCSPGIGEPSKDLLDRIYKCAPTFRLRRLWALREEPEKSMHGPLSF